MVALSEISSSNPPNNGGLGPLVWRPLFKAMSARLEPRKELIWQTGTVFIRSERLVLEQYTNLNDKRAKMALTVFFSVFRRINDLK